MTLFPRLAIALALVGGLALPGPVGASTSKSVIDHAGCFKAHTVKEATKRIRLIQSHYGRDVIVETFKTVPAPLAKKTKELDPKALDAALAQYARERARAWGAESIYVLIAKEPGPARVWVELGQDPEPGSDFTLADRDSLRRLLVDNFQHQRYDAGLIEALTLVRDQLAAFKGESLAATWLPVLWVLLPLVGLWFGLEITQVVSGGKTRKGYAFLGSVGYGGGGSFMAGLCAAMNTSWLRALRGSGEENNGKGFWRGWMVKRDTTAPTTLTYHGEEKGQAEPAAYAEDSYHSDEWERRPLES